MEATAERPGYEVWRPNREKASSKTMKAVVAFVLLVSAGLLVLATIGGWERLEGSGVGVLAIGWAGLYVLFAALAMSWNRGILPVASSLAVLLAIFAAVAAPGWFARAKDGLTSPLLPEELVGVLTILIIPTQLLLVAVAMIAFNQNWQVEEERPIGGGRLDETAPPHEAEGIEEPPAQLASPEEGPEDPDEGWRPPGEPGG